MENQMEKEIKSTTGFRVHDLLVFEVREFIW